MTSTVDLCIDVLRKTGASVAIKTKRPVFLAAIALCSTQSYAQSCDTINYASAPPVETDPVIRTCHKLTARKLFENGPDEGIEFNDIDASIAIPACEAAIKLAPDNPRLQFQLGRAYLRGERKDEAAIWFLKSADQKYPPGLDQAGYMYVYADPLEADRDKGIALLHEAACAGDPAAKNQLGYHYQTMPDHVKDMKLAIKYYTESADAGWTDAAYRYGEMLLKGYDIDANKDKGLDYILKAANAGHLNAQHLYGFAHGEGFWGVSTDAEISSSFYLKAAKQGGASAMGNIGSNYRYGFGVPKDGEQAAHWSRLSAYNGTPWGIYKIADLYRTGFGITQNNEKAKQLYLKTAEIYQSRLDLSQSDSNAAHWLGTLYENGLGVEKDYDKAVELYQSAAKNQSENAKRRLRQLGITLETDP